MVRYRVRVGKIVGLGRSGNRSKAKPGEPFRAGIKEGDLAGVPIGTGERPIGLFEMCVKAGDLTGVPTEIGDEVIDWALLGAKFGELQWELSIEMGGTTGAVLALILIEGG